MADGQYGPCVSIHRVSIFDRGGKRRVHNLVDVSQVDWARKRDTKSAATFSLSGRACDAQADVVRDIADAAGRYEAVIYRGDDRVWEGPIRRVETLRDNATFLATDIKEYLDRASLSKAWPNSGGGGPPLMGDRLDQIITHELSVPYNMVTNQGSVVVPRWENLSPPINVLPFLTVYPGTVPTRSTTEAFEMKLGEHLDNLVDGGMDFTVVGRRLVIWDSALSIGQTRTMTDADFLGDLRVIRYASDHWSISHMSASKSDEDAPRGVGHAGGPDDYYGVWENIVSMQSEEGTTDPTQTALNSMAGRDILYRTPVPLEVRVPDGVGIRLTHDLTIQNLIPGVVIPVTTAKNIQVVSQPQRLDEVRVSETAAGENVTVSMSPFGAAAAVI